MSLQSQIPCVWEWCICVVVIILAIMFWRITFGTSLQVLETVKTLEMRTRLLSACCSCLSIMAFIMLRFHADIFLKCVFKLFVQFISEDQIIKYLRFHFFILNVSFTCILKFLPPSFNFLEASWGEQGVFSW